MSSTPGADLFWASSVSERIDTREAVREAVAAIVAARAAAAPGSNAPPSLVLGFVSPHHSAKYAEIGKLVKEQLGPTTFIGTSAAGVIGAGRELEGREAISLTAAWLPEAKLAVFHFGGPPGDGSRDAWLRALGVRENDRRPVLVFADPQSSDPDALLQALDSVLPASTKVGGLVQGSAEQPAVLLASDKVFRGGALVCLLDGAFDVHAVVSQGCRPIGEPYIVTRSRGNVIQELNAGKPAEVLRKLYDSLEGRDQKLWNSSLFLGVEMSQQSQGSSYQHGDFLIRNVLGVDRESGAMAIDCNLSSYQVVQFHLRDREAAAQDLQRHLRTLAFSSIAPRIRGALLFSHHGRGERLYGVPNHDSDAFRERVSPVSLSGFFCNGEIGPVGERTFLHGYTSVYAVFSER